MTTHHDGLPASESDEQSDTTHSGEIGTMERPQPSHLDAVERIEHQDPAQADSIESDERLGPSRSAAMETNQHQETSKSDHIEMIERQDLPNCEDPTGIEDLAQPDAIESEDCPGLSESAAFERTERPDASHSDALESVERHDLPNSEVSIGIGDSPEKPPSEELQRQSKESRRLSKDDEVRDLLKAETGYSSYAAYLKAYGVHYRYMECLRDSLTRPENSGLVIQGSKITILGLSAGNNSRPRVATICASISARDSITVLRQPPASVAVLVVLWNTDHQFDWEIIDTLGLGLKIDARFFVALYGGRSRYWDPKFVKLGTFVATVVQPYNPDKLVAVPIVLIARRFQDCRTENSVEEEIGDTPSFRYPAAAFYTPHNDTMARKEGDNHEHRVHPSYARLLNWCLENEKEPADVVTDLALKPLVPLLYLKIFEIRDYCESIRGNYQTLQGLAGDRDWLDATKDRLIPQLREQRVRLRAMVEDQGDALDQLLEYIRSQTSAVRQLKECWPKVARDVQRNQQEAARLEAQVRDYLQLQVGESALQESRKSIELSNRQIEEGKRGQSYQ